MTILASLVLALGLVALAGYVLGIETVYGWGESTRMAFLSAVGLVIAGMAALLTFWRVDPRVLPLTGALATGVAYALFGFGNLRAHDVHLAQIHFTRVAGERSMLVRREVAATLSRFATTAASLVTSATSSREDFNRTVAGFLDDHPAVVSVEWLPRIPDRARSSFEAAIVEEGFADYRIRECSARGGLETAAIRTVYYPVKYVQPFATNQRILGFDHASEPVQRAAIEKAIAARTPCSTALIELPSYRNATSGRKGILTYIAVPHAEPGTPVDSGTERHRPLGLLCALLRPERFVESAWNDFPAHLVRLAVFDPSTSAAVDGVESRRAGPGPDVGCDAPSRTFGGFCQELTVNVGGRHLTVCAVATPEFMATRETWSPWIFLCSIVIVTLGLTLALHRALRDSARVEALVDRRTSKLRATNTQLEREIERRRDAEGFVRGQNKKLETLLYVASHDLREPLRAIANFSRIVKTDYAGLVDTRANDYLDRISRAAERLDTLMESLLALASVQRCEEPLAAVPARSVVQEAVARLEERIGETGASVTIADDLPPLHVEQRWAVEAVHNLLANALKFTKEHAPPEIEIAAFVSEKESGIVVRDRGPGVPPDQRERIFELFQRAVGREVEGTGTGLAIVHRIAEIHGGRAWTVEREGGGSEFVITFPLQRQVQAT